MDSRTRARGFYGSGRAAADNAVGILAAEFEEVRRLALEEAAALCEEWPTFHNHAFFAEAIRIRSLMSTGTPGERDE